MNPLDQLHDITTPDTISIWPLAWGWWVVIIVTIVLAITAVVLLRRYQIKHKARKQALRELAFLQDKNSYQQFNTLLKRVALAYTDSKQVAGLHGNEWSDFLFRTLKPRSQDTGIKSDFALFIANVYAREPTQVNAHALTEYWLKNVSLSTLCKPEASHV